MNITTKYNIEDVVWFMDQNKITSKYIVNILYNHVGHPHKIHYMLSGGGQKAESEVYWTKEELIKSL